ncbi:MAG: hypothetical protein ACOCYB_09280, partial [Alkalispirochaeta sp.]
IEVEEKTKTSNLVDNTSATALVQTSLGGDGERFLVRAGTKIFTREDTPGTDWSSLSAPSGYIPTFLAGINTDSSTDGIVEEVYAVFFDSNTDRDFVYRLVADGGSLSWEVVDPSIWNPTDGERITGFESVGDRILMASTDGQLYSLGSGESSLVDLGEFTSDERGIRAVATNAAGVTVVVGDSAVHFTANAGTAGSLNSADTAIETGRGVAVFPSSLESGDPADTFLLVTLDGRLYTSGDGDTWQEADGNIPNRSFSGVAWVDHRELLAVGTLSYEGNDIDDTTNARGYYEVSGSSSGSSYTLDFDNSDISDNYDGSELATSGIARFVYYPSENTLFALTHGKGLWRTSYEADVEGGPDWVWE